MGAKRKLRAWVKALRSGEYRQGTHSLVSADRRSFCCLGVYADLRGCAFEPGRLGKLRPVLPNGRLASSPYYLPRAMLPMLTYGQQKALAKKNDNGETFDQIAIYIETKIIPKVAG